jgi:hypothetical protein
MDFDSSHKIMKTIAVDCVYDSQKYAFVLSLFVGHATLRDLRIFSMLENLVAYL